MVRLSIRKDFGTFNAFMSVKYMKKSSVTSLQSYRTIIRESIRLCWGDFQGHHTNQARYNPFTDSLFLTREQIIRELIVNVINL